MEMFAVILVLVVVGFAVAAAASSQKRTVVNAAWRSAASHRGLLFRAAELLSGPEIVGTLDGCRIKVDTATRGGDSSKKYTRFRVEYSAPLNLGLKLTEQGMMSGVSKLLGGQDIEVGDEWFDQVVVVKSRDPEQAIEFLSGSRRQLVLAFFAEFPGSKITDTEITWEKSGVVEVTSGILNPIERMVELAGAFSTGPDDIADQIVEQQLESSETEIVLDEPIEPLAPPPLEVMISGGAKLPEFHIDEPPVESEEASESGPVDEPVIMEETPPSGPDSELPPADQLSAQTVAETLFGGSIMSYRVKEVFEEEFQGRPVQWSGILSSVAQYPFDRVFGRVPGTKAVVEIHEAAGRIGRQSVKASVQLPTEALTELRPKIGKPVAFEGELIECDGFMNNIFVGDGRILWIGSD